jgi:hypothetical protein
MILTSAGKCVIVFTNRGTKACTWRSGVAPRFRGTVLPTLGENDRLDTSEPQLEKGAAIFRASRNAASVQRRGHRTIVVKILALSAFVTAQTERKM